jgi:hypothetical protein
MEWSLFVDCSVEAEARSRAGKDGRGRPRTVPHLDTHCTLRTAGSME